ncbi:MAG: LssY C-terminal domain-containing protein [Candidatus Saccharimonadales bacterium]
MIRLLLRWVWRAVILLLGVAVLLFLVSVVWPDTNSRFAIFAASLFIYCLMAYLVIPNLIRLFHVFSRTNHIPLYVTTGDGWPSDPVNLAIIAKNRRHLATFMKQAGWHQSDPLTFRNGFHEVISILFNRSYPAAPLSNLYLFDRPHDIGFEIPTNSRQSARTRHHVRFWQLKKPLRESRHSSHYDFWREKVRHILGVESEIWIGAATEETKAIDIQWRTGRLTHGGSHESDKERDFIIESLASKKLVKKVHETDPGEPIRFHGQQFRTYYMTDGSLKIVQLK